jgi:hypothetical protein
MGEREQNREQDDLPDGDLQKPKPTWDWQDVEIDEADFLENIKHFEETDYKPIPPDGDPPSEAWLERERGREKIEQIPLQVEPEGSHSVGYLTGLDQFGHRGKWIALDDIRWRLEHAGTQDIGNGGQTCLIIVQAIGIPCREFRDLSFRVAAADLQKASVAQRQGS